MTAPTPPTDYHHHQGEALQHLHTAKPTNAGEHLAAANTHAALAIAAAVHAFHEDWNRPIPLEVTNPGLAAIAATSDLPPAPVPPPAAGDACPSCGETRPVALLPPCSLDQYDPHEWHLERLHRSSATAAGAMPSPGRRRIYVASSWRNYNQPVLVALLRQEGHEVYDFRNPEGGTGFSWADVKPYSQATGVPPKGRDLERAGDYLQMIAHPRARAGFESDFAAMQWADTFVMVLPCGKSAHLELGWAAGAGKRTAILLEDPVEPELMYLAADARFTHVADLLAWLGS